MVKLRANKESKIPTKSAPNVDRRRGRPIGKNRVPLTIEERRARNALYERERRSEASDAYRELAVAMSVDANIAKAELLAKTVCFVKERIEKSVADFTRQNKTLEWQVQKLTQELLQQQAGDQGETS